MTSGERTACGPRPGRTGLRPIDVVGGSCAALVLLASCSAVPAGTNGAASLPIPAAALLAGSVEAPDAPADSVPPDSVPMGDRDGDGVPNASDDCARTRVAIALDERGCNPFDGVIDELAFVKNGAALDDTARTALQPLLAAMRRHPEVVLELQGHTDNRGPAGGNLVLSKRRVMAVVRFLVAEGVDPTRLQPWGYGENRPLAGNATPEGRARNRRIEVRAIMPRQETGR